MTYFPDFKNVVSQDSQERVLCLKCLPHTRVFSLRVWMCLWGGRGWASLTVTPPAGPSVGSHPLRSWPRRHGASVCLSAPIIPAASDLPSSRGKGGTLNASLSTSAFNYSLWRRRKCICPKRYKLWNTAFLLHIHFWSDVFIVSSCNRKLALRQQGRR